MHCPSTEHWVLVKRLLCYLCGTLDYGVVLYRDFPPSLNALSDADSAGNRDDYTSTNAYIVCLGCNLILWTVALSSTGAEYCSVATTAVELN